MLKAHSFYVLNAYYDSSSLFYANNYRKLPRSNNHKCKMQFPVVKHDDLACN